MMVAFIDACREDFGVEPICAQLPIAPSSYYDAKSRPVSARARRHVAMTAVLVALWAANYRVYGARKLWLAARRAGHEIGRDQVAALMRAAGICGVTRRRRARTTVRDPGAERPGDLVNRDFTARSPNRLWVTDLTVAPTRTGAAYVCFIVDAFSRLIVGWRVAAHMRTEMVLDAVEMARRGRGARIEGLTVHSDAGSQGGFNRSLQHLVMEVAGYGCWQASAGDSCDAGPDVVAGAALDGTARGSGPVLGGDRWRGVERGRGRCRWGVAGGGVEVVPTGWRDATDLFGSGVGAVSELR